MRSLGLRDDKIMGMKVVIGADHGGYQVKEAVKGWLVDSGVDVKDVGADNYVEEDDFVDYAEQVAREVGGDKEVRGIVFCRNGVGVSIVANRFEGVRCALGFDVEQVRKARTDDDVNCLAIAADYSSEKVIKEMVEVFMKTEFSGEERFVRRLVKLGKLRS